MRIKKICIAMLGCVCLLGNSLSVLAETEDAACVLPQSVIDIANGSDDIFGPGASIVHGEDPNARFTSGGIDHTHQYVAASALVILNNDKSGSILNDPINSALLMEGADWPDVWGNQTDYMTFSGHFYDPDTGKNWLGQTSPTARTRAESYFQQAVDAYNTGNVETAMSYLGRGVHYVSDLNEPHHASNLTAVNSNHSDFEKYVDKNRKNYKVAGDTLAGGIYQEGLDNSVGDLMYTAAKRAKGLIDMAKQKDTYDQAGEKSVQGAITTSVQYIYKFGIAVGIY